MAITDLRNILKIFQGGEPSPKERNNLLKEALLMTLARASSEDSNLAPVEVATVRKLLKKATGEDVSLADIRVASKSEIFERAPLEKHLANVRSKLNTDDRVIIARTLAEVIKSDVRITTREIRFFDKVAKALKITPAELVGLVPD